MDFARLDHDLTDLRRRNRALGLVLGGLVVAQVFALAVICTIAGSERTIVVPPTIERSFWVTRERAGRDYLNQMAAYVSYLVLDVDPATVDWKKDALLDWIAPDQHAVMKARQELEAERLKRINAATYFRPQQLVADEERQSVVVRGRLRTLVNGQETSADTRSHLVEFDHSGGRLHIKTFKEIGNEQPALAQSAAAAGTR